MMRTDGREMCWRVTGAFARPRVIVQTRLRRYRSDAAAFREIRQSFTRRSGDVAREIHDLQDQFCVLRDK